MTSAAPAAHGAGDWLATRRRGTVVRVQTRGWNVLDDRAGILWRQYEFARGAYATTLVFRGADGLVVLSPPAGLEPADFDALREHGPVRALVATNSHHHMGQRAWRERFPDAESYCPPRAAPELAKKVRGVPFRSLLELELPDHVHWEDPPGFRTGETIVRIDRRGAPVWFAGDLLANFPRLPPPPMRWLFSLTDSAPGFRLFELATFLFVKDRKALREWMLARLDELPPAVVVPAHGPAFDAADAAERTREQILRL